MKRSALLGIFFVFCAGAAPAVPGRYIVELTGEPAAAHLARLGRRVHAGDAEFRNRVQAIRKQHETARLSLEARGAVVTGETNVVTNTLFVTIDDAQAGALKSASGVARVYPVRLRKRLLDHALPLMKIPDAWNQIGGMSNAGAGMKIAIIDTGIDATHPGFSDPSLSMPAGFPKVNQDSDSQYTNNKVIVARAYTGTPGKPNTANDSDGHGTGVAMVAAGVTTAGPFGIITGVAPKAYLGNYKVFPDGQDGAPDDLILKAVDDAVSDGMDVINLSLGSVPATRPEDDPLVDGVERAVSAGVIVTIAAGNEGSDPDTVASPGIAPDAITVGSISNDRIFAGSVQVAGSDPVVGVPGDGPNSQTPISGPLKDVADVDPTGLACGTLPDGSLRGAVALILRGTCTFETKINAVQQAGAIAALVYTDAARPKAISMATGAATLSAIMVSYTTGANLKQQLASGPLAVTIDFSLAARPVPWNQLSDFSSKGPNTDYGIKPDVLAVGESISTAQPLTKNQGFVVESGTSFSSPMMAGAAALLKAARPGLTVQQYRSLLISTASSLVFDSGGTAPVQQMGTGVLNMTAALNSKVVAQPVSLSFGLGAPAVEQTKTLTVTNIGASPDTFTLYVSPLTGSAAPSLSLNTVQLGPGQSQDVSVTLTGGGLSPGSYQGTIQIQGTKNSTVSAVPYWLGIGSDTPQYLTILESPTDGAGGSRQLIFFRVTDTEGIPVSSIDPNVTVTAGSGSVIRVQSDDALYPATFVASVRLGTTRGANTFHIDVGGLSKDVTIQTK